MNFRVLIVGGGFIGARLAHLEMGRGSQVTVIDRSRPGRTISPAIDWQVHTISASETFSAFRDFDHIVWAMRPRAGVTDVALRTLADQDIALCYLSSLAVYGSGAQLAAEDAAPMPNSAYGRCKAFEESIVGTMHQGQILRTTGVYGRPPSEDTNLSRSARPIWKAVQSFESGSRTVSVRFEEAIDQYLFLDDLCSAVQGLAGRQGTFNVGPGVQMESAVVGKLLSEVLNIEVDISIDAASPPSPLLDLSRISAQLPSWTPRDLRAGLQIMVQDGAAG